MVPRAAGVGQLGAVSYYRAMSEVQAFIADLRQRIDPLDTAICETYWQFARTGDEALQARIVELEMQLHEVQSDADAFARIRAWRDDGGHDAETARTLELLYFAFLTNQEPDDIARRKSELEAQITGRYSNFRAEVAGRKLTSNDIRAVLKESDDSAARHAAWEAGKAVGPLVSELVLELVRLRNTSARELGFRDYYDMRLQAQEVDEGELYALLGRLEELTREPFLTTKAELDRRLVARFGLGAPAELRPWHYSDPFFQEAPPLTDLDLDPYFKGANLEALSIETFDRVGLDIRASLALSDLYEREGKDQHAFCLMMGRDPARVHVLCNCRDNANWASTMLHEYGHAAYDLYLRGDQPYFLRDVAHTNSTEAIAMLFGRLTHDAAWLHDVLGLESAAAAALADEARAQLSFQMLVFTRWMMVMTHFERALYANPGQDLNRLWWDLVERYQGLQRPEGRDLPDWASKSHIAEAPVYYHNYMLGEMTASQLQHHIEHRLGSAPLIRQPQSGQWLRAGLFEQGALRPWNEALEHLTGERLNPDYFVAQFVRQPEPATA